MNRIDYFYHNDFTDHADVLKAIPEGTLSTDNQVLLAALFAEKDTSDNQHLWTDNPNGGDFTLANAVVQYNGANQPRFPTKFFFDNVLVLALSDDPCNVLYLQYEPQQPEMLAPPPVDPEPAAPPADTPAADPVVDPATGAGSV